MPELKGPAVVTGGAGFIGSSLTALLLSRGEQVVVLDNMVNGSRDKIEDAVAEAGANSADLTVIEGDVRDEAALERACQGAAAVFHLACLGVRHSLHSPRENHDVNAQGTLLALEVARRLGVQRFVNVSSSEVYGTARTAPMTEEHPTFPLTVYGASKLAGECYARAYHASFGYSAMVIRPFNAYGPRAHHEGDSGEVIPRFLLRAMAGLPPIIFGDGTQTRDFTYVTETARGILEVGLHPDAAGHTVNLGAGREISISALADVVLQLTERADLRAEHQDPRPGDVLRLIADSSRARDAFGFQPRTDLQEGLARTLAWYRGLGTDPRDLLEDEAVRSWER